MKTRTFWTRNSNLQLGYTYVLAFEGNFCIIFLLLLSNAVGYLCYKKLVRKKIENRKVAFTTSLKKKGKQPYYIFLITMLPPSYKTLIEQLSLSVVTRGLVIDFSVFTKIPIQYLRRLPQLRWIPCLHRTKYCVKTALLLYLSCIEVSNHVLETRLVWQTVVERESLIYNFILQSSSIVLNPDCLFLHIWYLFSQ